MQAVLQAAYLRQLLGVPPAGSHYPPAAGEQQQQGGSRAAPALDVRAAVAESGRKARSSLQPFISQVRGLAALAPPGLGWHAKHACLGVGGARCRQPPPPLPDRASPLLPARLAQLEEQGWQLTPFMLSSTEKQRYLQL